MLEHMAVLEYSAPKSLPLEQMISWKLHNMAIVPGIFSSACFSFSSASVYIFSTLFYAKTLKTLIVFREQIRICLKYWASVYLNFISKI